MGNKKVFIMFKNREDKQQKQASYPQPRKPQHVPRGQTWEILI